MGSIVLYFPFSLFFIRYPSAISHFFHSLVTVTAFALWGCAPLKHRSNTQKANRSAVQHLFHLPLAEPRISPHGGRRRSSKRVRTEKKQHFLFSFVIFDWSAHSSSLAPPFLLFVVLVSFFPPPLAGRRVRRLQLVRLFCLVSVPPKAKQLTALQGSPHVGCVSRRHALFVLFPFGALVLDLRKYSPDCGGAEEGSISSAQRRGRRADCYHIATKTGRGRGVEKTGENAQASTESERSLCSFNFFLPSSL